MEKLPENNQRNEASDSKENKVEKYNPNSIGELLNFGKDLQTQPDRVYRSVRSKEAIDDIENSGVVRNKQSAGLVEKSRWGDRVFWSKGAEGKYHNVQKDGYVIEAPLSVAQERIVKKEDITAIYTKNERDEVVNILKKQEDIEKQKILDERKFKDTERLAGLRKELGLDE